MTETFILGIVICRSENSGSNDSNTFCKFGRAFHFGLVCFSTNIGAYLVIICPNI